MKIKEYTLLCSDCAIALNYIFVSKPSKKCKCEYCGKRTANFVLKNGEK
jgi:hypothetical protein